MPEKRKRLSWKSSTIVNLPLLDKKWKTGKLRLEAEKELDDLRASFYRSGYGSRQEILDEQRLRLQAEDALKLLRASASREHV